MEYKTQNYETSKNILPYAAALALALTPIDSYAAKPAAKPTAIPTAKPTLVALSQTAKPALSSTAQAVSPSAQIDASNTTTAYYLAMVRGFEELGRSQQEIRSLLAERMQESKSAKDKKDAEKRARQLLAQYQSQKTPSATPTATPTATTTPGAKKPSIFVDFVPYADGRLEVGYGSTNQGSKTSQGTNLVSRESAGAEIPVYAETNLGFDVHGNRIFVPVRVGVNSVSLDDKVNGQSSGTTALSTLDWSAGLGYGREIKTDDLTHMLSLAGAVASSARNVDMKFNGLGVTKADNASGYQVELVYDLRTKKGKVVSVEGVYQGTEGDSKTTVQVPLVGTVVNNGKLSRNKWEVRTKVFFPASVTLEGILGNINETSGRDSTNYTELGGRLGWKPFQPYAGLFVGMNGIVSGSSSNSGITSELTGSKVYGGIDFDFAWMGSGKSTTKTAVVDAQGNTYASATPTVIPTLKATPVATMRPTARPTPAARPTRVVTPAARKTPGKK